MADFVVNGDMFGRYARIPTDNNKELHIYKVVSCIESNAYCNTPILCTSTPAIHNEIVPVLNVIHCGIDESKVVRVAMADCELIPTVDAVSVVRCKDCKHWTYDNYHKHNYCSNKFGLRYVCPENNFCSYGERREGE